MIYQGYKLDVTVDTTEKQTPRISGRVIDAAGAPVTPDSLKVTLYEETTGPASPINGRAAQSILNVNGGTVDAGGNFAFQTSIADQVMVTTAAREYHIAMITYTFNSGAQGGVLKARWPIVNEAAL